MRKIIRLIIIIKSYLFYRHSFYSWGKRSIMSSPDLLYQTNAISVGDKVEIRKGSRLETIGSWDGIEPKISIGDGTSIHLYFHCGAAESVRIGKDVLIAGRVYISDHDHEVDVPDIPPKRSGLKVAPVTIGDEVWIGEGAVILKGVTIGRRAVIGANAVVTKNVEPYTIVAGVPARVIRKICIRKDNK